MASMPLCSVCPTLPGMRGSPFHQTASSANHAYTKMGDFTVTVHYREYGAPAAAERPAARDTVDFADVTGAG